MVFPKIFNDKILLNCSSRSVPVGNLLLIAVNEDLIFVNYETNKSHSIWKKLRKCDRPLRSAPVEYPHLKVRRVGEEEIRDVCTHFPSEKLLRQRDRDNGTGE